VSRWLGSIIGGNPLKFQGANIININVTGGFDPTKLKKEET